MSDEPRSPTQAYHYLLNTPDGPHADFARWMVRQYEAWRDLGPAPDRRWEYWLYPGNRGARA